MAAAARWAVRCDQHTTQPTTRDGADRLLVHIEQSGHCHERHEVVEVVTTQEVTS